MPIASWFCNGYSKVLTALKCSKKLEKAVKAVFWNQLLFALKYVLALSKRLKDVFFFYVYLVAAKVPGTYYQARRSFSSLLGPLHWSSIFPTPREHRNIVQLCTRSPHATKCQSAAHAMDKNFTVGLWRWPASSGGGQGDLGYCEILFPDVGLMRRLEQILLILLAPLSCPDGCCPYVRGADNSFLRISNTSHPTHFKSINWNKYR